MVSALEMVAVRRTLRARPVLEGLSLTVEGGSCRALVGLNGAGKTTGRGCSACFANSGSIRIHGGDIASARGDLGPASAIWSRCRSADPN